MKIFCVDIFEKEIPQFYIKTETSQVRNNEPIYVPLFCEELKYEVAFAVKLHRVTKAISENFASRCWEEVGVVANFWDEKLLRNQSESGAPTDIARVFDRSFLLPNDFMALNNFEGVDNISSQLVVNGEVVDEIYWEQICGKIDAVISYISTYVTFKIGDVVMIRNCEPKIFDAKIGDKIELKIFNETKVETIIK